MPVPKDISVRFSDFLTLRFEEYNLEKFSCPYLSHFLKWQKVFAISVCIPVHSRLSWILFEEFFFLFPPKKHRLPIHRHTHTLIGPLKWKDVIQVIDLTQMKQDLLIPHESIPSSATRNWGRGGTPLFQSKTPLWVQGDYFHHLRNSCNGRYHKGLNP